MDPTQPALNSGRSVILRVAFGIALICCCFGFMNYVSITQVTEPDPYAATDLTPDGSDVIEFEAPDIEDAGPVDDLQPGDMPIDAPGAFLGIDDADVPA